MEQKKNLKYLLCFLFISNLIFSLFLIKKFKINNDNNKYLLISSVIHITLLLGIQLNIYELVYTCHGLFAYMILITIIFAEDNIVLIHSIMTILTITFIRRIYNHCIIRDFEKKQYSNDYLYKKYPYKWDYINFSFAVVAFIKILCYYKVK